MSWLEFVYSIAVLGLGFFLGWGLHLIETEDEMEVVIEDIEEQYERKLEYAEYEISTLRRENHKLQIRVSVLRDDIIALKTERLADIQRHKTFVEETKKWKSKQMSPEVKEAVKYAMKSAHPDNGGDVKDFMKFRELYNKIK